MSGGGSGAVSEAVARIEAELSRFWASSGSSEGDDAPKARATTMNFVAIASQGSAGMLRAEIELLAETRAGRVFLVSLDGRLAPWEVVSDTSAVCHKEGDVVICYDRVELTLGAMAASRVGSVLSALSVSEVPTIVEVASGAPSSLIEPAIKIANRIVVDSAHTDAAKIAEMTKRAKAPVADRAFVRAYSWRDLIARFFDDMPSAVRSIRRIEVARSWDKKHDPAALFVGWLASRLGWTFLHKGHAKDAAGGDVSISVVDYEGLDLAPGEIASVRVEAALAGEPLGLAVERCEGERMVRWSMRGARTVEREHPLGFRDETWVLLKAIDALEGDAVYRASIEAAAAWLALGAGSAAS